MTDSWATVNKILKYSVVDGPGNRLVIFLQGCNFNCPTCHNPYTIGICNHCGDCIPACHAKALSLQNGKIVFDAAACDQCDDCLTACPISSSPMTRQMSVEQVLEIARKNKAFLTGITVSGGEATLHLKFIIALFKEIKADETLKHLTCFIDTNGHLGPQSWSQLLPVTDGVMLDIKAFNNTLHKTLTGQSNERAIQSAKIISATGKLNELRFLLIPDKTATKTEIAKLTNFAKSLNPTPKMKLNAYQHHGVKGRALDWQKMEQQEVEAIADQLREAGLKNIVTPVVYF